ncbi:hypothetical protein KVV02_007715 [Mortierella alpina]|uniref:GST N-terminal domain-containing protein n=1 Tax=Mortierella alpina TaxID=64518 RepID=A0A9P7ZYD4_MORAP|nr:hypothetical protein KVV02_007715 [Mortierella alpina]
MTDRLRLFEIVDAEQNSFSPMVWRAKLALNHKNISHETVPVTFVQIPAEIPKACPNVTAPTVPTMQVGNDHGIQDSLAIAEYLEKTYPDTPSIFGKTESEKNLHRFFESYVSNKLQPAIQGLVILNMYKQQDPQNAEYFKTSREKGGKTLEQLAGDKNQNIKDLKANLGLIHGAIKQGKFVCGEQPGWADFTLIAAFIWFNSFSPEEFDEAVLSAFDDNVLRGYWSLAQKLIY